MISCLRGGRLYDPARGITGEKQDLFFEDDRMISPPAADRRIDREISVAGCVLMPGAIDIHTHIGGGKLNLARLLWPEQQCLDTQGALLEQGQRSGSGGPTPSSWLTGYRYAEMGYSACFEPAVLPANARQAHLEMADTPIIDSGGYLLLGNEDLLLRWLAEDVAQSQLNDYVAWMLQATQCMAVKLVNPAAINAFAFNMRKLNIDSPHPHYGVTPRTVIRRLARAVSDIGLHHPLHVHASNLGAAGNIAATLATIEASEGLPLHLTHVQFHSYGDEGEYGFSSAASRIAEALQKNPQLSVDVGQIMFGLTATISADAPRQYANHRYARPRKWLCFDLECESGCGIMPYRYRSRDFVNALQWAIGLEIFLLADDPWRVFLTTDHPNGAPFSSYPQLIRLLMDRNFRQQALAQIHPDAARLSSLASLQREYSLYEIAIMTRAAPARILGLTRHGQLGPGAWADICVYRPGTDIEQMFAHPEQVFRRGVEVVRKGRLIASPAGHAQVLETEYDNRIEPLLQQEFQAHQRIQLNSFRISRDEMQEQIATATVDSHRSAARKQ